MRILGHWGDNVKAQGEAMEKLLVRPTEGAEMLGLSRRKFYQLLADGTIPSITIGKARRIPAEALREFVRAQTDQAKTASETGDRAAELVTA